MGPKALSQVLRRVEFPGVDENLLVGFDKADDAVAYKLQGEQVIVQSVDFFTPVVDDPYLFGQIAAANALSDIYAMGATPLLAMNIAGFPTCLDNQILEEILQGGADQVANAGAIIAGGHTIEDDEPKYGLAVTGVVEHNNLITNSGAQVGDQLILTKPLGMGVMTTAFKGGIAEVDGNSLAVKAMATLNNKPVELMHKYNVNACTDITGFGLLGHAWELATGSGLEVTIYANQVPLFAQAKEYAALGLVPEGAYRNQDYLQKQVEFGVKINEARKDLLFDPQTSGGLLISVAKEDAADLLSDLYQAGLDDATLIGQVTGTGPKIKVRDEGN
ncbi:selenium donor protein [Halobacteroides halobius DSM 5150]|uniref:Selenide, water dikinase n=2 Tax=Halobacteroides TaxID=42417 RepID=L0K8Q2_HALHC|nr:selenium donor protein [Halobacteroides halobius DSM 5150]